LEHPSDIGNIGPFSSISKLSTSTRRFGLWKINLLFARLIPEFTDTTDTDTLDLHQYRYRVSIPIPVVTSQPPGRMWFHANAWALAGLRCVCTSRVLQKILKLLKH